MLFIGCLVIGSLRLAYATVSEFDIAVDSDGWHLTAAKVQVLSIAAVDDPDDDYTRFVSDQRERTGKSNVLITYPPTSDG